jgi:hypothetical protein
LAVTQQPAATTAGTATAVKVAVRDQYGNRVTGSTAAVTLTTTPASSTTGTSATAVAGEATFAVTTTTAGSYTLTATSPGLTSATSDGYTVRAAAAASIAWSPVPPAGVARQAAVTVSAKVADQYGNAVSGAAVTLTATRTSGNGGSTIPNVTVQTDATGTATFTGVRFSQPSTWTLTASAGPSVTVNHTITVTG